MKLPRTLLSRTEIGWREVIGLPDLDIPELHAKIDTGARTSALNAAVIRELDHEGQRWIEFDVILTEDRHTRHCRAPIADQRAIKNTSGVPEMRYIIHTHLALGARRWQIELSLTDRGPMRYDLILGRTALRGRHLCINPGRSFLTRLPDRDPVAPAIKA